MLAALQQGAHSALVISFTELVLSNKKRVLIRGQNLAQSSLRVAEKTSIGFRGFMIL
jgi:hypothetical protein